MNSPQAYFDENGYVVVNNALSKKDCDALVKRMFSLYEDGALIKDIQCPLSDSIYGDPLFDELMQRSAESIGNHIGKKLLPTYSYARIYRTGEVLKKHTDRPACQISVTITLGYSAKKPWSIFFDAKREIPVNLQPGEMAIYKGCDVVHWRQPLKGKWHVQVFFHYVDANGPYAKEHDYEWKVRYSVENDKRD